MRVKTLLSVLLVFSCIQLSASQRQSKSPWQKCKSVVYDHRGKATTFAMLIAFRVFLEMGKVTGLDWEQGSRMNTGQVAVSYPLIGTIYNSFYGAAKFCGILMIDPKPGNNSNCTYVSAVLGDIIKAGMKVLHNNKYYVSD